MKRRSKRRRMTEAETVELHAHLIDCVYTDCERPSQWVGIALKPSQGGKDRSDLTLFGVCERHRRPEWYSGVLHKLSGRGYGEVSLVAWDGSGILLSELWEAGLLDGVLEPAM